MLGHHHASPLLMFEVIFTSERGGIVARQCGQNQQISWWWMCRSNG